MTKNKLQVRTIKKYPNRRMYDEVDSRYVTLGDLRKLIVDGKSFRVLVDKTNEDQTSKILLQILLELELSGQYIFSNNALKMLIALNNSPAKSLTKFFLENSLNSVKN